MKNFLITLVLASSIFLGSKDLAASLNKENLESRIKKEAIQTITPQTQKQQANVPDHGNKPDTIWTKTFGGTGSDVGSTFVKSGGNNVVICGYTNSYGAGDNDVWLVKARAGKRR